MGIGRWRPRSPAALVGALTFLCYRVLDPQAGRIPLLLLGVLWGFLLGLVLAVAGVRAGMARVALGALAGPALVSLGWVPGASVGERVAVWGLAALGGALVAVVDAGEGGGGSG